MAKWVNVISIMVGLGISLGSTSSSTYANHLRKADSRHPIAGWFIYRATLQQMRDLGYDGAVPASEAEEARDFLEQNALLGDYSGDDDEDDGEERYGPTTTTTTTEPGEGTQLSGFRVGGHLERRDEGSEVTRGFATKGKTSGLRSGRM